MITSFTADVYMYIWMYVHGCMKAHVCYLDYWKDSELVLSPSLHFYFTYIQYTYVKKCLQRSFITKLLVIMI